eukprot:jgi/Botrbrau1/21765/Bobra.43_1s0155.1
MFNQSIDEICFNYRWLSSLYWIYCFGSQIPGGGCRHTNWIEGRFPHRVPLNYSVELRNDVSPSERNRRQKVVEKERQDRKPL